MIIVRLCGGLGNQMFQYAAGRRLALAHKVPLKVDLEWFEDIPEGDTPRVYGLKVFKCEPRVANYREVRAIRGADLGCWPNFAKRFLKRTGLLIKDSWVKERQYHFDPEVLKLGANVYLDGYWPSERYFADVEEEIRRDFTVRPAPDPPNRECARSIVSAESVALHVRRGDYVSKPVTGSYHGVIPTDYYREAVARMKGLVKNPQFFAFSDDPEWVRRNLDVDAPVTFLEHNPPGKGYEDLRLMSLCKHHIIANSTFSWWGAWLARNPGKVVFSPDQWFGDAGIDTRDLLPDTWTRIRA